jgi:hypothetical protein
MSRNPVHHKRTKHIELDIHFVREKVAVGEVRVLPQRENPCLPCVKIFAVRFISGARQRACLSCVFYIAHGKEKTHAKDHVCRAFLLQRTAKYFLALHIPSNPNVILLKKLCRAHYFRCTANSCVCRAFLL